MYEEEKEYNILKGQIPDFGYDVKFAVTVDGAKTNKIPERQKSEGNYYNVKVSCENGSTQGEWDYNAWNVKLDNISDGSKCTLAFTGGMSKEDYQKYIEEGIVTRRNTYRGKDLTNFFKNNSTAFYKQISEGTFDDIYVGDYIIQGTDASNRTITWLVADIDNYLNTGEDGHILTQHHLTMIPAVSLQNATMNDTSTTVGGYKGSKMYKETLNTIYSKYIQPVFTENHIIKYSSLVSNQVNNNLTSNYGYNDGGIYSGASTEWEWVNDRKLDLMSEVNVYGTTVVSSSMYDTGIDNRQYALFKLKPEFINSYGTTRLDYWLKGVASKQIFVAVSAKGAAGSHDTIFTLGVRPRFLIG